MNSLFPILLGIIILLSQNVLLDYYEKINSKFDKSVDGKIMTARLVVGASALIIFGLVMLIK